MRSESGGRESPRRAQFRSGLQRPSSTIAPAREDCSSTTVVSLPPRARPDRQARQGSHSLRQPATGVTEERPYAGPFLRAPNPWAWLRCGRDPAGAMERLLVGGGGLAILGLHTAFAEVERTISVRGDRAAYASSGDRRLIRPRRDTNPSFSARPVRSPTPVAPQVITCQTRLARGTGNKLGNTIDCQIMTVRLASFCLSLLFPCAQLIRCPYRNKTADSLPKGGLSNRMIQN